MCIKYHFNFASSFLPVVVVVIVVVVQQIQNKIVIAIKVVLHELTTNFISSVRATHTRHQNDILLIYVDHTHSNEPPQPLTLLHIFAMQIVCHIYNLLDNVKSRWRYFQSIRKMKTCTMFVQYHRTTHPIYIKMQHVSSSLESRSKLFFHQQF